MASKEVIRTAQKQRPAEPRKIRLKPAVVPEEATRLDREEHRAALPIHEQEDRRVLLGRSDRPAKVLHRFHGLMIDFLDHVTGLQTSVGGATGRTDFVDHHAMSRRRQLQLLRDFWRQVLDGNALQGTFRVLAADGCALFLGGNSSSCTATSCVLPSRSTLRFTLALGSIMPIFNRN
jgi:hypothetical protein